LQAIAPDDMHVNWVLWQAQQMVLRYKKRIKNVGDDLSQAIEIEIKRVKRGSTRESTTSALQYVCTITSH
jgi:hypothetical protein